MLDQARSAMATGDPARALSTLDEYARGFPHGALAPEASVLRVEALVAAGDRPAAMRAAQSLLKANPTSPYAQRIESLLGSPNP
jgi:outer membrane protein assembly factor BamD (BamD/ComL family)